jgi:hypothetical protein
MTAWIVGLGIFAVYLAVTAAWGFTKTYRKPPPVWDTTKEWGDQERRQ